MSYPAWRSTSFKRWRKSSDVCKTIAMPGTTVLHSMFPDMNIQILSTYTAMAFNMTLYQKIKRERGEGGRKHGCINIHTHTYNAMPKCNCACLQPPGER
jgi:hypothetical protein